MTFGFGTFRSGAFGVLMAAAMLPVIAFADPAPTDPTQAAPGKTAQSDTPSAEKGPGAVSSGVKADATEGHNDAAQDAPKSDANQSAVYDSKQASEAKYDAIVHDEAAKETPDRFMDAPEATGGKLPIQGMGRDWQLNFQPPGSGIMRQLETMHIYLLWLITIITLFVLGLMVYIMLRFREKRNPVPSKTSHNSVIEAVWTIIPILILIAIAIPSLRLHYNMAVTHNPEMTIKVVGRQWFWQYEYPDQGHIAFDSYLLRGKDLHPEKGDVRMLSVDNKLIVPVDTTIRVLITAGDVIHSWSVPAFGVKRDAIPGRLNETWFRAGKIGVYFGQCSQLCGPDHGFMPIEVHVVSKEDFARWVETAKKKYSDAGTMQVAALN